ncbi:MAG: AhpC/TSA family protein [Blastochloris sp.]|nr:AhpC/TSA family protein [Blastochloris sp.]
MTSTAPTTPVSTIPFQQQIDEFIAQQVSRLPAELLDDLTSPIQELVESRAAEKALQEGSKAPDFTLPDEHGQPVTLSKLLEQGPVVITFYRGVWCNFCNLEMNAYQHVLPALQELGASIVAISPQKQEHCLSLIQKNTLTFPVLSDIGNTVSRQFGLVFTINKRAQNAHNRARKDLPRFNGDDSWELPIPATYLIDQSGTIRLAYVDPDFMQRLDPATVVARIKELKK